MTSINGLINKHDWSLLSWRERYGLGTWVALSPATQLLSNLEFIKSGSDIESIELESYLHDKGQWLPVVYADSFELAIRKLDVKIGSISEPLFDAWGTAVQGTRRIKGIR